MMKKLLFLTLLFSTIFIANAKPPTGPSIGLIMYQNPFFGNVAQFTFSIKNTGDETLTNIYVTNLAVNSSNVNIYTNPSTVISIASLAPGEENSTTFTGDKLFVCFDQSQTMVHATTVGGSEITDLSSDTSFFSDNPTYSYAMTFVNNSEQGVYEDTNNNNIVDVGDVVNYTYNITASDFVNGIIFDSNAIVANPNFADFQYNTTGIHYITQAEVDLGYVYNNSYVSTQDNCGNNFTSYFFNAWPCSSCPNPNNANIVIPLTSDLPNQISGTVHYNINNDNCATAISAPNRRINTSDTNSNTYSTYTNGSGAYHILIPNSGNYTTTALSGLGSNYSSAPASIAVTSSGSGQDYSSSDFCISSSNGFSDLTVGMYDVSNAVPGSLAGYSIYYYNNGMVPISGSVQLNFPGNLMTFNNGSTLPNSSTPNSLTWNFTNLMPFQWVVVQLGFNISTSAVINQVLPFTLTGNNVATDNNPNDNTYSWNQTVKSSFDPNDKTVIEGNSISLAQAGNYLTYVTRFQNTGSANASTVVVKETLDPKLDWDTFEPIASSHSSNIQIRNGNDLTYTFSNIDLAYQSANESSSHGWMAYRIKPKANVVIGDIMNSNSNIYFDYNPPILTNTVATQITALATQDFVKNNFTVYPNPASDYLVIKAESDMDAQYEIIDINGKLLLNGTVESMNPITINALQNGFYFINIKTNQGKATYKFIKN
jgi:uncharacterized repeat protein (TIGR01451 family)